MTGIRDQQSLPRFIWATLKDICQLLLALALLVGLILLIPTSIVLALGILLLLIPVATPLLFVLYAGPWLNDLFRRMVERDVNSGSLPRLPPEILQEIFVHCCDQEYIDFYHHFSLEPIQETRYNTVYALKGVCKRWKFLAETTPALWRRIRLGSCGYIRGAESEQVFRSLQHCTSMMEQVLLPRSGQLTLQVQFTHCCNRFHQRHSGSPCMHTEYTLPLLKLLAQRGHLCTSLEIVGWGDSLGDTPQLDVENLTQIVSSTDLRHLEVLTLNDGPHLIDRASPQPCSLNIAHKAPRLAKLVLLGRDPWMLGRGGIIENLIIQWARITTLELDLGPHQDFRNSSRPAPLVDEVAQVLRAVRHSLTHLSWRGDWYCGDDQERMMAIISASKLPEIFGGPQLVLSSLHSLTLADRDNQFQFSTIFLPRLLCPKLKVLRVLLCTGDRHCGYKLRETSVARSPPIDGLRQLLHSSPNLRRVTILHAGISGFRYELESDHIGKGLRGTMYGYLVFHGTRGALQSQVADRLGRDAGLSSRHSLSSLSQHSPDLTKRILSRIAAFVPWYTYSTDTQTEPRYQEGAAWLGLEKEQRAIHLTRPIAKPLREILNYKWVREPGSLLPRTFAFVEDIARDAPVNPNPGCCALMDRALQKAMPSKDLSILASILDLVRCPENGSPVHYGLDPLSDTCIFTIAVPLTTHPKLC